MSILDNIKTELNDYLDYQPYQIKCAACGAELEIDNKRIDRDLDLFVKVIPCDCVKDE